MPYPTFDRSRLRLQPLAQRKSDLDLSFILALEDEPPPFDHPDLPALAEAVVRARRAGAAVIMIIGAHVVRAGVSRFVIDLLERGVVTHLASNGAAPIHDFEFALAGETTESVARYIRTGEFGLWEETGRLNEAARQAAREGLGLGEAIGQMIAEGDFPHREISIFAAAYRLGVPATVHVGVGYDIIHEHPNCDGAALGAASYTDFLVLAQSMMNLEGGVLLNFGSAVMGPEVYLKALAMARNVARQEGWEIAHFTTAVFDLVALPDDFRSEPPKSDPRYYFRPWKTILVRTVAEGGTSYYIRGDHRATVPALHRLVVEQMER